MYKNHGRRNIFRVQSPADHSPLKKPETDVLLALKTSFRVLSFCQRGMSLTDNPEKEDEASLQILHPVREMESSPFHFPITGAGSGA